MGTQDDKAFYDTDNNFDERTLTRVISTHREYFASYERRLRAHFSNAGHLVAVELGAGTCALSLLTKVALRDISITALDISWQRMQANVAKVATLLGTDCQAMTFEEGDFSRLREKPSESIDLILFDASLHHARSMWDVLDECRRVVSPRGLLIAQREQYLGTFTAGVKLSRLLKTPEVRSGVSENAYLKEQYEYYFRATGFHPEFIPCPEKTWQKILAPLNGFLFSKWTVLATPKVR